MNCDFCGDGIGIDETGFFCLEHEMGGHIVCAFHHNERFHNEDY